MKTSAIRYRGLKPRHVRRGERRPAVAQAGPEMTIRLPRDLMAAVVSAWSTYRRRGDGIEEQLSQVMPRAVGHFSGLLKEYPIADEIDARGTWNGWRLLVEFCMRVNQWELCRRVIPELSRVQTAEDGRRGFDESLEAVWQEP